MDWVDQACLTQSHATNCLKELREGLLDTTVSCAGAGHPAVHYPDLLRQPVARFYLLDDLFHCGHVVAIAGEHFIAHRHPFARHHQRDADLFAIGSMVATIAPAGERIAFGQTLEVANPMASAWLDAQRPEWQSTFPAMRTPTLGIGGGKDVFMWESQLRDTGQYLKGPWRYELVPDASHWVMLDHPKQVTELILEWLAAK